MQTSKQWASGGAKKADDKSKKRKRPTPSTTPSKAADNSSLPFDDFDYSSGSDSDDAPGDGLHMENYRYDKNEDLDEAAGGGDPSRRISEVPSHGDSKYGQAPSVTTKYWENGDKYDSYEEEEEYAQSVRQPAAELYLLSETWRKKWARPAFSPPLDPMETDLVFQLNEIDYTVVQNLPYLEPQHSLIANDQVSKAPVLRLFGTTATGQSILALVYGFLPYGYIQVPNLGSRANLADPEDRLALCREMRTILDVELSRLPISRHLVVNTPILSVEIVFGLPFKGWVDDKLRAPFFKVTVALPGYIPHIRTIAETGFFIRNTMSCVKGTGISYETDVPFTTRFQSDYQLKSCQWLKLPAGSYHVVEVDDQVSYCSTEVMVGCEHITPIPLAGEGSKQAPIRTLSFDIECISSGGGFPVASEGGDCVVQISGVLKVCDGSGSKPLINNVFCYRETSNLDKEGVDVHWYETEQEMLRAWRTFIITCDPDIITGYNIANFDLKYIWERTDSLKMPRSILEQSRVKNYVVTMRTQTFSSKARGKSSASSFSLLGRIVFDFYLYIRNEVKLRLYTLQYIVKTILGKDESKEDMDYKDIPKLFAGSPDDRKRLAWYCYIDSLLVDKLVTKTLSLVSSAEMARLTGVSMNDLFSRGQTLKVKTLIHQWIRKAQLPYFVPTRNREERERASNESDGKASFEGAVVIEPIRGFYEVPIATLDFASLYPSIMLAHNLCFSTYIQDTSIIERNKWVENVDYKRTPAGHFFVTKKIREGVCPQILDYLIKERKAVRELIKSEKDKFTRDLLDQRQLAIKVAANSVYGFTGATTGPIHLRAISESVTAYGREMINKTRDLVMEKYSKKNGHPYDAQVIYGDTDSVMVNFGTDKLEEAIEWGTEAAAYVTTFFEKPISLTYEKCYKPYLLIAKKRYAGLKFEGYSHKPSVDAKGVESVRRDNCTLVKGAVQSAIETILYSKPEPVRNASTELLRDMLLGRPEAEVTFNIKEMDKTLSVLKNGEKIPGDERMLLKYILRRLPEEQQEVGAPYLFKAISDSTPEKALRDTCGLIAKLRMNEIPYSELTITKKFSKPAEEYKNLQAHLEVNKKLKARGEPGYVSGDRIEYVITAGGKTRIADDGSVKQVGKWAVNVSSRAEDHKFAELNRIPVCLDFYTGMLIKPIGRLLEPIVDGVHKRLRFGPHMMHLHKPTPGKVKGLITMFTQVIAKCNECKTNDLPAGQSTGVCNNCANRNTSAAASSVATPMNIDDAEASDNMDVVVDESSTGKAEEEEKEVKAKRSKKKKVKKAEKEEVSAKVEENDVDDGGDMSIAELFAPRDGISLIDKYFDHAVIPVKRRKT